MDLLQLFSLFFFLSSLLELYIIYLTRNRSCTKILYKILKRKINKHIIGSNIFIDGFFDHFFIPLFPIAFDKHSNDMIYIIMLYITQVRTNFEIPNTLK